VNAIATKKSLELDVNALKASLTTCQKEMQLSKHLLSQFHSNENGDLNVLV
jgi:hypothetical protein